MIFCPGRSRIHSAHIGQDCVIHYRWHALFGRRVRPAAIEQRAHGSLASVEVEPGLIIKIPAWMLDPASCAGMEIGAPRASVAALAALHQVLVGQGFRRSSSDDGTVNEEEHNEVVACSPHRGSGRRTPRRAAHSRPGAGPHGGVAGASRQPAQDRRAPAASRRR